MPNQPEIPYSRRPEKDDKKKRRKGGDTLDKAGEMTFPGKDQGPDPYEVESSRVETADAARDALN